MSMPGWQDSHERDSQNGDVSGPLTGQIIPLEPALIGPAVAGPEKPASLAWIFACCGLQLLDVVLELVAALARAASSATLFERALWMRSRRSTSPTRIVETSSRSDSICLAILGLALLERVQPLGGGGRVGLGVGDDVHDLRVLARDALHELGAGQQVGEALGLEHDRDRVGRVGLVELDEPLRRARGGRPAAGRAGASAGRAPRAACAARSRARRACASRLVCSFCWRFGEPRDVALERVDPPRLAGDVARQHPLAGLVAADQRVVAIDLLLDLPRRLGVGADREDGPEHEREARDQGEQEQTQPHAARPC